MNNTENDIKTIKDKFNNILKVVTEKSSAVQVRGNFSEFCPHLQFITLDALKKEDWPNNIDLNSIYLCFEIDFKNKKVQVHGNGSIYLSPKDKQENSRWKYYAMRGMMNIAAEDYGVKKFRKQGRPNFGWWKVSITRRLHRHWRWRLASNSWLKFRTL